MPHFESSRRTFLAAAPIGQDCMVKLGSDGVQACAANDVPVGVTDTGALAAGDHVSVRLLNSPGTVKVKAGGAITAGQVLGSGASGAVVKHASTSPVVGMAITDAASGGIVEMMPLFSPIQQPGG